MSGLTAAGFDDKRLDEIIAELGDDLKSSLGAGINLDADAILGQIVGVFGEQLSELWDLAQAIYSSQYPDSASDVSLDNVVDLVGLTRQAATFSTVAALLTGTDGSTIPSGSQASVEGRPESIFATQSAVGLTRLACARALIRVATVSPAFLYTITVNGVAHDYTSTTTVYLNPVAVAAADTFTITGQNVAARFYAGRSFTVTLSTGNNGTYTVLSSLYDGADTIVTVVQDVTANSSDGQINLADDAGDIAAGLVAAVDGGVQPVDASASGADSVDILADDITVPFSVAAGTNLSLMTVSAYHSMQAVSTGATDAPQDSLTVIVTPSAGWLSVNNPVQSVVGRDEETDAELRLRRAQSLKVIGAGTVDAIRARLLEVDGVTSCNVNENTGDATLTEDFSIIDVDTGADEFTLAGDVRKLFDDFGPNSPFDVSLSAGNDGTYTVDTVTLVSGNTVIAVNEAIPTDVGALGVMTLGTLPEHSFEAVVDGGDNQDIADTVWANKPAGIQTFGVSEEETAEDSEGNDHTIYFSRPSQVEIYCDVTVTTNPEESPPPVEDDIIAAVEAYFDGLTIGGDVIVNRIEAAVILSTTAIATVVVKIGFTAAPSGTANLAISKRQKAVLAGGGLTVVIV